MWYNIYIPVHPGSLNNQLSATVHLKSIIIFLFALVTTARAATFLAIGGTGVIVQDKVWNLSAGTGHSLGFFENRLGNNPEHRLTFYVSTSDHLNDWHVEFAASSFATESRDLELGQYIGATMLGSASLPILNVSGNGYGSSGSVGEFNIRELTWTPDHLPDAVAVDFYLKHPTSNTEIWGSLRHNSNIPVGTVPEPSIALLGLSVLAALLRRKR